MAQAGRRSSTRIHVQIDELAGRQFRLKFAIIVAVEPQQACLKAQPQLVEVNRDIYILWGDNLGRDRFIIALLVEAMLRFGGACA